MQIVHRRFEFRVNNQKINFLKKYRVNFYLNKKIKIVAKNKIKLIDKKTHKIQFLNFDYLLV